MGQHQNVLQKKFKFNFCTSIESDLLENKNINILFIATRHDTHADYVLKGINNNKNIFVEKPLCIKETDLEKIQKSLLHKPNTNLMVGFNRRFAPLALKLKEKIGEGPMSIIYRINAGQLPSDSWIQDLEIGGGRIIGEVCHFYRFFNLPVPFQSSESLCFDICLIQQTYKTPLISIWSLIMAL